jgi:hypothetical protein
MLKNTKKILEYGIIGLFLVIVVSLASVSIYRSVINSDWFSERQMKNYFIEMTEKVNNSEKIEYIKVENNGDEKLIYDVPEDLFDDISCDSFESVKDPIKQREIFSGTLVAVFYEDGTYTAFFITNEELYFGTDLKIKCPSLMVWVNEIK